MRVTYHWQDATGWRGSRTTRVPRGAGLLQWAVVRVPASALYGDVSLLRTRVRAELFYRQSAAARHDRYSVELNEGRVREGDLMYPDIELLPLTVEIIEP